MTSMPIRIKICGITRPEDGLLAAQLGVDAIGLVFYPGSPRYISIEQAQAIIDALPPFITVTALFMDATPVFVRERLESLPIDLLQFHGGESPSYCEGFGRRYIKSVPMIDNADIAAYTEQFASASGFLLDAVKPGEAGGTGRSFDWNRVPENLSKPLILAGGLNATNIVEAIQRSRCYAVDVSSGVEASKGVKDAGKMRELIGLVKNFS